MVEFHYPDVDFRLSDEAKYETWIEKICSTYNCLDFELNYIFCSDEYLLKINNDYLNHNYYTDIITFPLNDDPLTADLFISIERVVENANKLSQSVDSETLRVMSHGLLHLFGFNDKNEDEKILMRNKEASCISLF